MRLTPAGGREHRGQPESSAAARSDRAASAEVVASAGRRAAGRHLWVAPTAR
jgi:hypothetical protein